MGGFSKCLQLSLPRDSVIGTRCFPGTKPCIPFPLTPVPSPTAGRGVNLLPLLPWLGEGGRGVEGVGGTEDLGSTHLVNRISQHP